MQAYYEKIVREAEIERKRKKEEKEREIRERRERTLKKNLKAREGWAEAEIDYEKLNAERRRDERRRAEEAKRQAKVDELRRQEAERVRKMEE